jgi:HTH-type transcriptional regulator/antitoxin HigA
MDNASASDESILNKNYGKLLQQVKPQKIKTEQAYAKFVTLLEKLLEKEDDEALSEPEILLVELLTIIVQEYETQQITLSTSNPLTILLCLMEAKNIKPSDLADIVGSSSVTSEIMSGKRNISQGQARSLSDFFNVPYNLFL